MAKAPKAQSGNAAIEDFPGYYIRRLHQIVVGKFLAETADFGITPVQWAAMSAVRATPGMDQRTLARRIGFDTSTIGGVVDRLERRGLIERRASTEDRRVRLLAITPDGVALLSRISPTILDVQEWLMAPLSEKDRKAFLKMLRVVVEANSEGSRAPLDTEG